MPVNKERRRAQRLKNGNRPSQDPQDIERSKYKDTINSELCPNGVVGESLPWKVGDVIPLQNKQYHMTPFGKIKKA